MAGRYFSSIRAYCSLYPVFNDIDVGEGKHGSMKLKRPGTGGCKVFLDSMLVILSTDIIHFFSEWTKIAVFLGHSIWRTYIFFRRVTSNDNILLTLLMTQTQRSILQL